MVDRAMDSRPPADILEAVARHTNARQQPAAWKWQSLTTTNPATRIAIDGRSWILKKSRDGRKDEILSRLFDEYGIPHHQAIRVGAHWVLMRDAGAYTLESMPREFYSLALFAQLGRLAASALLVGMRDRKLGNIAANVEAGLAPALSHIDYEGAFRAGLVNRVLRPKKYYRYLLTRLLFDVARRFEERDVRAAFALFLDAFCEEWDRLQRLRPSSQLRKGMLLREQIMLRTGRKTRRARALMESAFTDLVDGHSN